MKKIFLILFLILSANIFIFPENTLAVETATSSAAVKYNIVFPIASLGNCNSIAECKVFCDNPVNAAACASYGKSKDLYKQNPVAIAAKTLLGCDITTNSCREFCAKKENYPICKSFGEKYLKIASGSAVVANVQNQAASLCANFCATNPETCKPKNLPLGKYSQLEALCKSLGCTWSNFTCSCPNVTTSTSSATTSAVNRVLPVVQGISIEPNLIQLILLFFMERLF